MTILAKKNLEGVRAVVIGGGVAGLSCAIALACRGARVRVLEPGDQPAGHLSAVQLGGYTADALESTVVFPHALGRLFALADLRLSDFVRFRQIDPIMRVVLPGGESVKLWTDPDQLAAEVARFSPSDALRVPAFLAAANRLAVSMQESLAGGAGSRASAMARRAAERMRSPRQIMRPETVWTFVRSWFSDPRMRQVFAAASLGIGMSSVRAPLATTMAGAWPLSRGAWAPEGGMAVLGAALVRAAEVLGVRISTGCMAERIELSGGRVRAVSGMGFKPLGAHAVVSTCDPLTMRSILRPMPEKLPQPLCDERHVHPGYSAVRLTLATRRTWDVAEHENLFLPVDPREGWRQLDQWRVPEIDPTIRVSNPSAWNAGFAPKDHSCLQLTVPAPASSNRFTWRDNTRREWRDRLVSRLEQGGFEGLRSEIVEEKLWTPEDFEREGRRPGGAIWGGTAGKLSWARHRFPQTFAEIPGLYLAGEWTEPGPSMPLLALGAMQVAEKISN